MSTRFDDFIGVLLGFETDYNPDGTVRVERDPDDPGGTTKFGIDQRSHPGVSIAALTLDQAKAIYLADWQRLPCEQLPRPLGELLFDIAQNGGPGAKWIQQACNVTADGFIGPKTLAAAAALAMDAHKMNLAIYFICDQREDRFRSLCQNRPRARKYLQGWLNRNSAMLKWAIAHPPVAQASDQSSVAGNQSAPSPSPTDH
jgi:lysozyme family protein